MIIGLTSFLSAGKDTICNYLKEKDFEIHSCSDLLREECKTRNLEITRDNLQNIGNELRSKFGPNILAQKLATIIKKDLSKNYVVDSIRTPGEIEELKKLPNFVLVFIDVDSKIRYERAKERLKEKEHVDSYEEFIESEKKELTNNPNFQQLHKCKELADITLLNNKTIDELKKEISLLLVKLQVKFRDKPDWHRYFLNIAEDVAKRSNCLSAHGGAIITINNIVASTGYIGAPRETKDCYDRGYCLRRKLNVPSGHRYEICASVHAEQNAIINAAREGVSIKGGTLYLFGYRMYEGVKKVYDAYPCFICKKMIINAGIETFVGQQEDGSYKVYNIKDWIEEWKEKEIIDDNVKYEADYK